MGPDKVAIVCPFYFYPPPMGTAARRSFLRCWRHNFAFLDHCILDVHYYHFDDFDREVLRGSLESQVRRNSHELNTLPAAVVGEFSAMRAHADEVSVVGTPLLASVSKSRVP